MCLATRTRITGRPCLSRCVCSTAFPVAASLATSVSVMKSALRIAYSKSIEQRQVSKAEPCQLPWQHRLPRKKEDGGRSNPSLFAVWVALLKAGEGDAVGVEK
jgi:hypothetical protein